MRPCELRVDFYDRDKTSAFTVFTSCVNHKWGSEKKIKISTDVSSEFYTE